MAWPTWLIEKSHLEGILDFPSSKWKLLSCVWFFATPWTVACQVLLSMVTHQARKLEWVAISFSRGSSQPRGQTQVSHIAGGFMTVWATREALPGSSAGDMSSTPGLEAATYHEATKPMHQNSWAHVLQWLKPTHLEPTIHNKKSHHNEKPMHHNKDLVQPKRKLKW